MPETNIIESLINAPSSSSNHSLEKLAMYLSSNKNYKYTTTYLIDSDREFKTFRTNLTDLKSELLNIFSLFNDSVQHLPLELLRYNYELQINNAVLINSKEPDSLNVIDKNEDKLLMLLNQRELTHFYLTLKFSYDIQITLTPWVEEKGFIYNIEHTFEVKGKNDLQTTIDRFINILKLDLCAKASYINK